MPRDPRVEKLQRLRGERATRAAGGYHGTRATAYGNVQGGPRPRNNGRTLLSLVILIALVVFAVYSGGQYILHGYHPTAAAQSRTVIINVTPGESVSSLAANLQAQGLIFNATAFHWYMRLTGSGGSIQPGPHRLHTDMTMSDVVQALSTAPPPAPTANVTIWPGWRAEQVATALDQAGVARYDDVMNEVQRGVFTYPFLSGRPTGAGLEGFLLPETYTFLKHGGAHYAINRILSVFGAKVSPQTLQQGIRQYGSFYKALILASIVEREAGTAHDRYLVASVYSNRLHDRSGLFTFLDADPTIQYAVNHAPDWWAPITAADINRSAANPFNTYKRTGLPPQPIAEPSVYSIEAAVNPAHSTYFYFRHINGSHGMSIFCTAQEGPTCQRAPE